jgi:hypothetical protein
MLGREIPLQHALDIGLGYIWSELFHCEKSAKKRGSIFASPSIPSLEELSMRGSITWGHKFANVI